MFEWLQKAESLLKFISYQKMAEISDPFYYRQGYHRERDEKINKIFREFYDHFKDFRFEKEKMVYIYDDIEDGIFIEVKKDNKRYYIINGNCPLKGVHIDYDEERIFEDVSHFGSFIVSQTSLED